MPTEQKRDRSSNSSADPDVIRFFIFYLHIKDTTWHKIDKNSKSLTTILSNLNHSLKLCISSARHNFKGVVNCQNLQDKGPLECNSARG